MPRRTPRPSLPAALVLAVLALLVTACAAPAEDDGLARDEGLLAAYGLEGLDARQVIDTLEATPVDERPKDLVASVRPDVLLLSDDASEVTLPMPEDAFYVSVAPYVAQTHECTFHSLTTCQGEMRNTAMRVRVEDRSAGTTLVDETLTTHDNGFVGLWLPRDVDATLSVEADGRTTSAPLSTTDDDLTCVTTLRLA